LYISWGTKGDNTTPMDLGVASKAITGEKGVEAVEVELEDGMDLINRNYDEALDSLLMKPEAIREVIHIHMLKNLLRILISLLTLLEPSTKNKTG
jgi:hypothetical protein